MKKAQDLEITTNNIAISVVGEDTQFKILSPEEVAAYLPSGMVNADIVI
jgi:hypothetical protein